MFVWVVSSKIINGLEDLIELSNSIIYHEYVYKWVAAYFFTRMQYYIGNTFNSCTF